MTFQPRFHFGVPVYPVVVHDQMERGPRQEIRRRAVAEIAETPTAGVWFDGRRRPCLVMLSRAANGAVAPLRL